MRHFHDVMTGEVFSRRLDENGHEVLSSEPHERAQTGHRPETIAEQVRRLVQSSLLAQAAQSNNMETFEEADDFDVGDDFDPTSPYEEDFDPPVPPQAPAPEAPAAAQPSSRQPAPSAPAEGGEAVDAAPTK